LYKSFENIVRKLANTSSIEFVNEKVEKTIGFVIKGDECFIDLGLDITVDIEQIKKDLAYNIGFKKSVEAKLANEKFVANAKPELIERERQKLADTEAKIKALEEALTN
jgi:valyl-tRNA synthetase